MGRLTIRTKQGAYDLKQTSEQKDYYSAFEKLGKLEDIMEKYGIESVEELDAMLKRGITYERACELACEELREDYCINCDLKCDKKEMCDYVLSIYPIDYFYEQAQKEKKYDRKK